MARDQSGFNCLTLPTLMLLCAALIAPELLHAQGHGGGGYGHGYNIKKSKDWGFGTSSHSDDTADD